MSGNGDTAKEFALDVERLLINERQFVWWKTKMKLFKRNATDDFFGNPEDAERTQHEAYVRFKGRLG